MGEKTLEEAAGALRVFAKRRRPSSRLSLLEDESAYCVLTAAACLGSFAKMWGFEQQGVFSGLLRAGIRTESDLRSWLGEFASQVSPKRGGSVGKWVSTGKWDAIRRRAQEFLAGGIKVFLPAVPFSCSGETGLLPQNGLPECPGILFGKNCPSGHPPLLAVFNSRKPRQVLPDSNWLDVLRRFLQTLDCGEAGLAGSIGTLTYDLASTLASRLGSLHLMVAPFPLVTAQNQLSKILGDGESCVPGSLPTVSCMLDGASCPAKLPMRCRDRLLAGISDFHLVLEVRAGGNLQAVLENIQSKSPRPQLVLKPETPRAANAGNFTLLKKFPEHAAGFKASGPGEDAHLGVFSNRVFLRKLEKPLPEFCLTPAENVDWRDYLFHYTRACNGPWPGETYRRYLFGLLEPEGLFGERLLSGGTALDTLVRIAREGFLRGSGRMVRSRTAVVCWSSLSPRQLSIIRKWRPALVRWTVEPYGVAVRRDILRALGAKPAIYGEERVYSKICDSEKFRFQLSRPGASCDWRHEREWRSAGDLALGELKSEEGFFFVQTAKEAQKFNELRPCGLPVLAMSEGGR